MRNGRTSRKRRATIVSSVMPSPPRICMLRSTTRQIASEQMTLAMLDSCVPRSPWSSTQAACQITGRLWWNPSLTDHLINRGVGESLEIKFRFAGVGLRADKARDAPSLRLRQRIGPGGVGIVSCNSRDFFYFWHQLIRDIEPESHPIRLPVVSDEAVREPVSDRILRYAHR